MRVGGKLKAFKSMGTYEESEVKTFPVYEYDGKLWGKE